MPLLELDELLLELDELLEEPELDELLLLLEEPELDELLLLLLDELGPVPPDPPAPPAPGGRVVPWAQPRVITEPSVHRAQVRR